jgi:hypothetical protein
VVLAVLVLGPVAAFAAPRAEESRSDLRESLRQSTITAIQMEIDAYTVKLQAAEGGTGSGENAATFRQKIEALEAERDRFDRMTGDEYPDPVASVPDTISVFDEATAWGPMVPAELRQVTVTVDQPYDVGSQLAVEGTSRSGPFFHLAGVRGGDAAMLKKGKRYRLDVYLVYRREYFGFIGDYYVYVAAVR